MNSGGYSEVGLTHLQDGDGKERALTLMSFFNVVYRRRPSMRSAQNAGR